MQKIIVLDFTTSKVFVGDYDRNIYEDGEEWIIEMADNGVLEPNVSPRNCQWMIVNSLSIEILNQH